MANHNWAPQSPDLSGYAPQSPDLSAYNPPPQQQQHQHHLQPPTSGTSWAPQSPDISGFHSYDQEAQHPPPFDLNNTPWNQNQPGYALPYQQSPHQPSLPQYSHQQLFQNQQGFDDMPATRSHRVKDEDAEWAPQASPLKQQAHRTRPTKTEPAEETGGFGAPTSRAKMDTNGVEVKTKFPTARIKRIMQADEDVGKVAQVTPVVMAKALELFMIRLITSSAGVAKSRGSKRVQTQHMKAAVMQDDQFDNLREIVDKIPDAPNKGEAEDGDEENGEAHGKKRKKSTAVPKGKKRRESDDDF